MDTEFVHTGGKRRGSVLLQVGLGYAPDLCLPTHPLSSRPTIKEFVQRNQVRGSTVNITLSAENQQLVRSFNNGKIPFRKTSEFWEEQDCGIGELDDRMSMLVRLYKEDASSRGRDLVLVTFAHGAEWRYLTIYFPTIAQYFTSWLDVRQLAKADTFRSNTPPLKTCLTSYGYHWMDITCGSSIVSGEDYEGDERNTNADNAGNDACMTLALLECLQDPEFRQRLINRQTIEAIVHLSEKPPWRELFVATFEPTDQPQLPGCLSNGYQAARYFWEYEPISIGLKYKARCGDTQLGKQAERGWVAFRSKQHLARFVGKHHNALVGGQTLKVTRVDRDGQEFKAEEELRQRQMQQTQQERKLRRDVNKAKSADCDAMSINNLFGS
ncbi:hypothetical protein PG996_003284 [Apiospora saccharicola]|uniref:Uncharacterized protein n=1 Tax=Apiospora saccharicola TaxID=335842 RepID=A0ABR1W0V3_9PEZI